jgi:hypothetical protein
MVDTSAKAKSRAIRLALLVFAGREHGGTKALNASTGRIRFLFLRHPSLDRLGDAPTEGAEAER